MTLLCLKQGWMVSGELGPVLLHGWKLPLSKDVVLDCLYDQASLDPGVLFLVHLDHLQELRLLAFVKGQYFHFVLLLKKP